MLNPETMTFKRITVSERTVHALGEVALGLPDGHPVRAEVLLLLARWRRAESIAPQHTYERPEPTRPDRPRRARTDQPARPRAAA